MTLIRSAWSARFDLLENPCSDLENSGSRVDRKLSDGDLSKGRDDYSILCIPMHKRLALSLSQTLWYEVETSKHFSEGLVRRTTDGVVEFSFSTKPTLLLLSCQEASPDGENEQARNAKKSPSQRLEVAGLRTKSTSQHHSIDQHNGEGVSRASSWSSPITAT